MFNFLSLKRFFLCLSFLCLLFLTICCNLFGSEDKLHTTPGYGNPIDEYTNIGLLTDKFAVDEYGKLYIKDGSSFDDLQLKKVEIPQQIGGKDVKALGVVFTASKVLEKIKLENTSKLTKLNNTAFYGCGKLEYVSLPEELTEIGIATFSGCAALTEIDIPENVNSIGAGAFSATGLESFGFTRTSGNEFSIGALCFAGCKSLKTVELSEGLESVEDYLFYDCSALETVRIPKTVTLIGRRIFAKCRDNSSSKPIRLNFNGNVWFWNLINKPANWNSMDSKDDSFVYNLLKSGEAWNYDVVSGMDTAYYSCYMLNGTDDTSEISGKCCIAVLCSTEGYDSSIYEPLLEITSTPAPGSHEYIDTGVHYNFDGMEYELKYKLAEDISNNYKNSSELFATDNNREKYKPSELFNGATNMPTRCLTGIFTNVANYDASSKISGNYYVYNGIVAMYAGDYDYPHTYGPMDKGVMYLVNPYFRDNSGLSWTYNWDEVMLVKVQNKSDDFSLDMVSLDTGVKMSSNYNDFVHSNSYVTPYFKLSGYVDYTFALLKKETSVNTIPLFCGKYIKRNNKNDDDLAVEYANFVAMSVYYYKIYYLTETDEKILAGFFVPCRNKKNGEIGMYDLLTNSFKGICRLQGEADGIGFICTPIIGQWFDKHIEV